MPMMLLAPLAGSTEMTVLLVPPTPVNRPSLEYVALTVPLTTSITAELRVVRGDRATEHRSTRRGVRVSTVALPVPHRRRHGDARAVGHGTALGIGEAR